MTTRAPRVVAVNGGLGDPSSTRLLVDRIAEAVARRLGSAAEVEVIDLRDLAVDIGASMTTGFAAGAARDAVTAVESADALIVASPVFNASYSGLFKSFFDLVDVDAMAGKPVLIGATGGSPRHSMVLDHAMRPLFSYLRTVVIPTGVYAAAEDWAGTSGDTATLSGRIDRAAEELVALLSPRAVAVADDATESGGNTAPTDRRQVAVEAAGIANFARLLGNSAT
ncbi:NADPH-dependent FMN reductase [Gordonia bronchialis DSM 43247]|uniref:NADPH-dependent FMN reductase n=1 Tax=Gordonia bronchialis (strain ATCC 25592 / DSM 43247 / BCRC 13721 / JCM 3198 / KCTC 3076 / NBRC 16047 / NCTC 10667) TaxID=526226 RepID=D0L2K8_GORB4|nr:FMN reductase [Gordonia bronchialis]ACY22911.1 NADPH-dependent FMN reductase [Gordonia bronchialis DSM 43247]MCC3325689.1 FMN reductase [Gordonia bronchialis]QGS23655.1 oxidoreductase [Gordonia bronchialis]STQ65858.1 FMN reductase (NADPH) [Gordonia bronchialis]